MEGPLATEQPLVDPPEACPTNYTGTLHYTPRLALEEIRKVLNEFYSVAGVEYVDAHGATQHGPSSLPRNIAGYAGYLSVLSRVTHCALAHADPFTLRQLQQENGEWTAHNFPDAKPYFPILGAMEEMGELCHAHLKGEQGIRYEPEKIKAMKEDAVSDAIIFLADYCNREGIDMQDALERTWAQVKQRDWQKDPLRAAEAVA